MKFVYAAAVLATTATAAHNMCAGAVTVTSTNTSSFADGDTVDTRGATCGTSFYRDQYYKYVATCDGAGLVTIAGNLNFTNVKAGVFAPDCAGATPPSVATGSGNYDTAAMQTTCVSPSKQTSREGDEYIQRFQFVAVKDQEYLIAVGTTSMANATNVGEFAYSITLDCAGQASNIPATPTVLTAGRFAYSNIAGIPSTDCTAANNVFFEYDAPCDGDVEFGLVPPPSGYDGFHGEDFKIALYQDEAALTAGTSLACQDDPAIITSNTSETPSSRGFLIPDGISAGKHLVVVGSYSNDVSPFVIEVTEMVCPPTEGSAAGLAVGVATIFGALML